MTELFPSQSFCDGHCEDQLTIVTDTVTEIVTALSVKIFQGGTPVGDGGRRNCNGQGKL